MRKLWTVAALLTSQLAFTPQALAQIKQDVIYKKDGSILRGTLIEQDFTNGRYKIQLAGGSIFAVSKDEITKISKEVPLNSTVNAESGVHINIENNPTITQSPTQTLQQNPTLQTYGYTGDQTEEKSHSIRIGRMSKNITDSDDNGVSYTGFNIAYQYNLDENFAFYAEYNNAVLDANFYNDEHYVPYYNEYNARSFTGTEVSTMFSTNNYQGWQFYAGLGFFNEDYSSRDTSNDVSGLVVTLGMGYSWQTVQLQLRISGHSSSDYGDDRSSSNTALQLGFNF